MTQKERLVKLLVNSAHCVMSRAEYEETAEFLIDNGIIVSGADDALPAVVPAKPAVPTPEERGVMFRSSIGADGKAYLDKTDIAKRYGCTESKAQNIIRGIKDTLGGTVLGSGKVLLAECELW